MSKLGSSMALVGDKELQKTLLKLSDSAARQIMRPAITAGLKPVRQTARDNAAPGAVFSPEASGLMRKAISASAKARKDSVTGKVFVNRKVEGIVDGKKHVPGNIAHLVEFGHGGKSPAPAYPFLRTALGSRKSDALKALTNKARELLPRVIQKLRAKGKPVYIGDSK